MTRVLVTGATGGLGRSLVPVLVSQGCEVTATGRDPAAGQALRAQGARFVAAELRGDVAPLLSGIDTVFHLAALSSPWGAKRDFHDINVGVTARLLQAARAAGCRRFIFASTPSIYAEPRHRNGLTEADPVAHAFANAYAATKYEAEQLVRAAHAPDFQTIALRPRAIVGPHDRVILPRLRRFIDRGLMPLPGAGKAQVEITDARDAAAAFLAACRCPALAGQAVNISGGAPRSVRQLVGLIRDTLGVPLRLLDVPAPLALAWAGLAELGGHLGAREPRVTRYSVMILGWSQTFDLSLARSLLGWEPRHPPEDAIRHALHA